MCFPPKPVCKSSSSADSTSDNEHLESAILLQSLSAVFFDSSLMQNSSQLVCQGVPAFKIIINKILNPLNQYFTFIMFYFETNSFPEAISDTI